jgi:hypothetical protein
MTEAQHPARRLLEALQEQQQGGALVAPVDGMLDYVLIDGDFNLELAVAAIFPYPSGDFTVIGPECFTSPDGERIMWRGEPYIKLPDIGAGRETTTSTGTTVTLQHSPHGDLVIMDHPDAPDDIRNMETGRIVTGGFQAAPFSAVVLQPETLRAIATLIEAQS